MIWKNCLFFCEKSCKMEKFSLEISAHTGYNACDNLIVGDANFVVTPEIFLAEGERTYV